MIAVVNSRSDPATASNQASGLSFRPPADWRRDKLSRLANHVRHACSITGETSGSELFKLKQVAWSRAVALDAVAMAMIDATARRRRGARLSGLSSENGRPRVNGFPTKEIIRAGPGVDFGLAHPAFEFAGMLVRMLLACCGIVHTAAG